MTDEAREGMVAGDQRLELAEALRMATFVTPNDACLASRDTILWVDTVHRGSLGDLLDAAANEIERLHFLAVTSGL